MLRRLLGRAPGARSRVFGEERDLSRESLQSKAAQINSSRAKRALDLIGSVGLLLSLFPVLLVLAVAVALESKGPVLFRQDRYGRGKKIFKVYKFRTMRVAECSKPFTQAVAGDNRLTGLGRLLRHTSLDELPQLINVVMGDMSLVGPRPHAVIMDDHFGGMLPGYADRHLVRPGMTGLAQVRGYRGPTQTSAAISQRLRFDRDYIESWSFGLELQIIACTPTALIHSNAI